MIAKRKLIEVVLLAGGHRRRQWTGVDPSRHPSRLHLRWARRPRAAVTGKIDVRLPAASRDAAQAGEEAAA